MNSKKPIIIFTGPSGVGKGTIEELLFQFKELKLSLSCSATTRAPRNGEIDGQHYYFISKEDFKNKIDNNQFIEYSFHFDNYYGTLFSEIDRIHNEGNVPLLEIETNGAMQILEKTKDNHNYYLITIFVLPPSIQDLESRIINRNTESKESLKKRIIKAQEEMSCKSKFKYLITNDVPERAANEIREILIKETQ